MKRSNVTYWSGLFAINAAAIALAFWSMVALADNTAYDDGVFINNGYAYRFWFCTFLTFWILMYSVKSTRSRKASVEQNKTETPSGNKISFKDIMDAKEHQGEE